MVFLVIGRYDKIGRDWCSGVLRSVSKRVMRRLRIVETDGSGAVDFGEKRPAGVFAYAVPVEAVRSALQRSGAEDAPVVAFPQLGSAKADVQVRLDADGIADAAARQFDWCECASVAWIGAHAPSERGLSDAVGEALAAAAARRGLAFTSLKRPSHGGLVMRPAERDRLEKWLLGLPKPCGVLAWTDLLAKEVMDACREDPKRLKAKETVFAMGIGNDELVCDFANPPLASVELEVEDAGCAAARAMEARLAGKEGPTEILCQVRQVKGRDSANEEKSRSVVVAQALKLIDENVCGNSKFGQHDIAKRLGISLRKLQLCFKSDDKKGRTILQAIQDVRLKRVCWLLARTRKTIRTVTFESGFGSVSRLKAIFLERYGMTMREWRKQHRK